MNRTENSQRVRRRFRRALTTYDDHALVQDRMAALLLEIVRQRIGTHFGRVLEIGAGTGLLTRRIRRRLQVDTFYANDLVEEVAPWVQAALPGARLVLGDAETIDHLPTQLELILSNATFQWIADPRAFLAKLHRRLGPGGHLVFSSFGPDNFRELAELLQVGLRYLDLREWRALSEERFQVLHGCEERVSLQFPDLLSLMRHLQALGVNGVREHRWSRSAWNDLSRRYQATYGSPSGLTLTHHPLYLALTAR